MNVYQLGCQPKWGKGRFLESINDEIQAVQDLEKVNNTIFGVLASSKYS